MSSHPRLVSGINPISKEKMFPLGNNWPNLTNYFLTRDGKEIWSFYRENSPRKLQDKNGYVKLAGTSYNISKIFNYAQKTENWKEWLVYNNYQEMKKNLDEEYGINIPIEIKKEPGSYLSDNLSHQGGKDKFVIGKIDEGEIILFYRLEYYTDEESARKECELFAKSSPFDEYVYLQIKGTCKFGLNWY